ncbi:MAG: (2Fe-2S)-binding protein [Acidimicrobiales bacterium]
MFICHCRAVTDRTVRNTIAKGACSVGDIAARCGAGSRCGGCHLVLARMLADAGLAPEPTHNEDFCAA